LARPRACGRFAPGRPIPASRERDHARRSPHDGANAYAELESEGLIRATWDAARSSKETATRLKITPPAPPVLNGNGGNPWETALADERGKNSSAGRIHHEKYGASDAESADFPAFIGEEAVPTGFAPFPFSTGGAGGVIFKPFFAVP